MLYILENRIHMRRVNHLRRWGTKLKGPDFRIASYQYVDQRLPILLR